MLEPAIDRFGRLVRHPWMIEVRQNVLAAAIESAAELTQLGEPGRGGGFDDIDQFA